MRDYQPYKNNPYLLPKTLYKRALATIRDYDRAKAEYEAILEQSPDPPDGQPRGTGTSDPTTRAAIIRALISTNIETVDKALEVVPEEYRKGVWDNITKHKRFPDDAGRATYARWKQRFIYQVARNLYLI